MPIISCFYRVDNRSNMMSLNTDDETFIFDSTRKLIKNRLNISKKTINIDSDRLILNFNFENDYNYTLKVVNSPGNKICDYNLENFKIYAYTNMFKLTTSFLYDRSLSYRVHPPIHKNILYTDFQLKLFINKFRVNEIDNYIQPVEEYTFQPGKGFVVGVTFRDKRELHDRIKNILHEYRSKFNKHLKEIFNQLIYKI